MTELDHLAARAPAQISMATLARFLWRDRLFILGTSVVAVIMTIVYIHTSTFKYTTYLQVTPVSTGGVGAVSLPSGLRSIASLAGIAMPSGQDAASFDLYLELLKSVNVATELMNQPQIARKVFSSEWSEAENSWKKPPDRLGGAKRIVKAVLGVPARPWVPPNGARLQEYLQAVIKIESNPKVATVTLRLEHADRDFSSRLLLATHMAADQFLRRKAMNRAQANIAYLSEKLSSTSIAELRMAIAQSLSEQEKVLMSTSATIPFAAEPIGEPFSSLRPTAPRPIRDLILALLFGLVLGASYSLARGVLRSESTAGRA